MLVARHLVEASFVCADLASNLALEQTEEEEIHNSPSVGTGTMPSPPRRGAREQELLAAYGQLGDANEVLNERAVAVMKRMSDKLTGRDFLQEVRLSVGKLSTVS